MDLATIPSHFPLQDLVGQEVTQVCVGIGQIQLHFYQPSKLTAGKWEPGAHICSEEGFELVRPNQLALRALPSSFKVEAGVLSHLLGERIVRYESMPLNELKLWFTGEVSLQLLTEPQGFESYSLNLPGNSIIVMRHSVA